MPESETWKNNRALVKALQHAAAGGGDSRTSLLKDDELGTAERGNNNSSSSSNNSQMQQQQQQHGRSGMGSRTPSKAELLEPPRGMDFAGTKSWEDVRQAANGMAAAIKRSFTDLRNLETKQ